MKRNDMPSEVKVLFVCHGNICRSTMAESVMTHLVKQKHLDHFFEIASAATSREEIGEPPHYGTVNKLRQVGIPVIPHRAVQMTKADYDKYDYLIGMDTANIRNMNRIVGSDPEGKIYKLLSFAGSGSDVADPWYTGDFDATYRDVVAGCEGLIRYLQEQGEI
jgi:protein-tyrosine phosphatase